MDSSHRLKASATSPNISATFSQLELHGHLQWQNAKMLALISTVFDEYIGLFLDSNL